jgi:hypothetical protein
MRTRLTACSADRPAKHNDFGGEQGIHAETHVRELCPFPPHPEQFVRLRGFKEAGSLNIATIAGEPLRPSMTLATFLALRTLGSLNIATQPSRPSRAWGALDFGTGSVAFSSVATRRSDAVIPVIPVMSQVRLL